MIVTPHCSGDSFWIADPRCALSAAESPPDAMVLICTSSNFKNVMAPDCGGLNLSLFCRLPPSLSLSLSLIHTHTLFLVWVAGWHPLLCRWHHVTTCQSIRREKQEKQRLGSSRNAERVFDSMIEYIYMRCLFPFAWIMSVCPASLRRWCISKRWIPNAILHSISRSLKSTWRLLEERFVCITKREKFLILISFQHNISSLISLSLFLSVYLDLFWINVIARVFLQFRWRLLEGLQFFFDFFAFFFPMPVWNSHAIIARI